MAKSLAQEPFLAVVLLQIPSEIGLVDLFCGLQEFSVRQDGSHTYQVRVSPAHRCLGSGEQAWTTLNAFIALRILAKQIESALSLAIRSTPVFFRKSWHRSSSYISSRGNGCAAKFCCMYISSQIFLRRRCRCLPLTQAASYFSSPVAQPTVAAPGPPPSPALVPMTVYRAPLLDARPPARVLPVSSRMQMDRRSSHLAQEIRPRSMEISRTATIISRTRTTGQAPSRTAPAAAAVPASESLHPDTSCNVQCCNLSLNKNSEVLQLDHFKSLSAGYAVAATQAHFYSSIVLLL